MAEGINEFPAQGPTGAADPAAAAGTEARTDLLILGADWVVTMDPERRLIRDGGLAVRDGRIVEVGLSGGVNGLKARYPSPGETIDARGHILMPGLINAHFHTTQQLARGLADNVFITTWIHERIFPYEAALTPEDVRLSSLCACLEAVRTGTTCLIDPGGFHMGQAAAAVEETGVRAALTRSMTDLDRSGQALPGRLQESTEGALAASVEFMDRFHGAAEDRIRTFLCLRTERMVSDTLCERARDLAVERNTFVGSHCSSNHDDVRRHQEIHRGERPLRRFHRLGLTGPRLLVYHCNDVEPDELEMLVETRTAIAHCPTAAFMGAYGALRAKHSELVRKGAVVSLGSDSGPESNTNDMFRVMFACCAHRDYHLDATLFPPETILEMALLNGARAALWEDRIGSLEPGKAADFILVDTLGPEMVPVHNPLSNLVHSGDGRSVRWVVVDGRVLMREGRITTVDEREILARGQAAAVAVAARTGLDRLAAPAWPVVG